MREHDMGDERAEQQDDDGRRHAERTPLSEEDDRVRQAVDRQAVGETSASPRATPSMPSVTMNGGIAPRVIRKPLTKPAAVPAARQARMPIGQGRGKSTSSTHPHTPDRASTEPSERSMPAEEMTKVAPIASTPMTEVASRMLRKLETDKEIGRKHRHDGAERGKNEQRLDAEPRDPGEAFAPGRAEGSVTRKQRSCKASCLLMPPPAGAPSPAPGGRGGFAHFTYCSIGSLLASSTALVSTSVGTKVNSSTFSPASTFLAFSTACLPTR